MPAETTLHIFSFLDRQSLGRAAQVCRTWSAVSRDKRLWTPLCPSMIPQKFLTEVGALQLCRQIKQSGLASCFQRTSCDFGEFIIEVVKETVFIKRWSTKKLELRGLDGRLIKSFPFVFDSISISEDGSRLVGIDESSLVFLDSEGSVLARKAVSAEVRDAGFPIALCRDGTNIVTVFQNKLMIWNQRGERKGDFQAESTILESNISASGTTITCASLEAMSLLDSEGHLLFMRPGQHFARLSDDGNTILLFTKEHTHIEMWNREAVALSTIHQHFDEAILSLDGSRVATLSTQEEVISIWSQSGRHLTSFQANMAIDLCLSFDGTTCFTLSSRDEIHVWQYETNAYRDSGTFPGKVGGICHQLKVQEDRVVVIGYMGVDIFHISRF